MNDPTSHIVILGERREIIQCGQTQNVLLDTCLDAGVIDDVNEIGLSLLLVVVIAFCLRRASMAG